MSVTKEQFMKLVDWYRVNKPDCKRISVDLSADEMSERFKKIGDKYYYEEFEVVRV